jgi:hypothetical protein
MFYGFRDAPCGMPGLRSESEHFGRRLPLLRQAREADATARIKSAKEELGRGNNDNRCLDYCAKVHFLTDHSL